MSFSARHYIFLIIANYPCTGEYWSLQKRSWRLCDSPLAKRNFCCKYKMIVSQQKCPKNIPNIQIRQLQCFLILNKPKIFLDLAILGVSLESAVSV